MPAMHVEIDEIRSYYHAKILNHILMHWSGQTYETNLFSVMRMCQKFAPLLMNAKGTIVQIGSLAGVIPYVFGSVYNSSKAALHSYSNTLRVELAPFDVRVVTIVTGGVKSNIARTHRELPSDSIYLPIKQEYEERLVHSQTSSIPNEQYAATVVSQVLNRPSNHVWAGGKSWLVWFVSTFLPRWVMDRAMSNMFKLWKLKGTRTKKIA